MVFYIMATFSYFGAHKEQDGIPSINLLLGDFGEKIWYGLKPVEHNGGVSYAPVMKYMDDMRESMYLVTFFYIAVSNLIHLKLLVVMTLLKEIFFQILKVVNFRKFSSGTGSSNVRGTLLLHLGRIADLVWYVHH